MLAQERHRPGECERGILGAEARAALAVEAVAGAGVNVIDAGRVRLPDALDAFGRNRLVAVAEMVEDGTLGPLVEHTHDPAPVIGHRRRDRQLAGSDVRDRAAPAKPYDAD